MLEAIQYLTTRVAHRPGEERKHVAVDAEGYRARHEDQLAEMAQKLAERVDTEGKIITFDPMNARDRRIVHMAIKDVPGVRTESNGEGPDRRVKSSPSAPPGTVTACDRIRGGRYTNLDGTTPDKGLGDIVRWQVRAAAASGREGGRDFVTPRRLNDGAAGGARRDLTWIGHATFVNRTRRQAHRDRSDLERGDPALCAEATLGARREARCLPKIDVVTVSHAHYDHFDLPTLREIGNNTIYVVPENNGDILRLSSASRRSWSSDGGTRFASGDR